MPPSRRSWDTWIPGHGILCAVLFAAAHLTAGLYSSSAGPRGCAMADVSKKCPELPPNLPGSLCYHSGLPLDLWQRGPGFQRWMQTCEIQWRTDLQKCRALLLFWLTISPQMIFILGKKFSEVISQLAEQLQMFSDLRTLPSSQRTGNRAPHASTFHICKELLCQQASFGRSLPLSI